MVSVATGKESVGSGKAGNMRTTSSSVSFDDHGRDKLVLDVASPDLEGKAPNLVYNGNLIVRLHCPRT
jgi:hypothetical protein